MGHGYVASRRRRVPSNSWLSVASPRNWNSTSASSVAMVQTGSDWSAPGVYIVADGRIDRRRKSLSFPHSFVGRRYTSRADGSFAMVVGHDWVMVIGWDLTATRTACDGSFACLERHVDAQTGSLTDGRSHVRFEMRWRRHPSATLAPARSRVPIADDSSRAIERGMVERLVSVCWEIKTDDVAMSSIPRAASSFVNVRLDFLFAHGAWHSPKMGICLRSAVVR